MKRIAFLLLSVGIAFSQIGAPTFGYIVDPNGGLRPVLGVEGAFTLGQPIERDVVSAAFSGKTLVVKKETTISVNGRQFDAPAGSIVVKFDSRGQLDVVRFLDAEQCWSFRDGHFRDAACQFEPERMVKGVATPVKNVSQMSEEWLVVYAEDRVLAIRGEKSYELPEATDEN